jgi:hypothetical protein
VARKDHVVDGMHLVIARPVTSELALSENASRDRMNATIDAFRE